MEQRITLILVVVLMTMLGGCGEKTPEIRAKVDFKQVDWYAKRAKAAYQSEAAIRASFPDTVRVINVPGTDVQYFLESMPNQKRQVVSIRGTANLANIKEDAEYLQSKNTQLGIFVHRGFEEDASKVYNDLKPHLNKSYQIQVTGHSLGAAISTLLMMYLYDDGYQVGPSVNFGQPKVTNKHGAEVYGKLPLLRVVDKDDLVPLLPATTLLDSIHGQYVHFGDQVILLDGDYYVYLNRPEAMKRDVSSFWDHLGEESVKDHLIANYIRHIEPKLTKAVEVAYADMERYLKSK